MCKNNSAIQKFITDLLEPTPISLNQVFEVTIGLDDVVVDYYVKGNQGLIHHAKADDVVRSSMTLPWRGNCENNN